MDDEDTAIIFAKQLYGLYANTSGYEGERRHPGWNFTCES